MGDSASVKTVLANFGEEVPGLLRTEINKEYTLQGDDFYIIVRKNPGNVRFILGNVRKNKKVVRKIREVVRKIEKVVRNPLFSPLKNSI